MKTELLVVVFIAKANYAILTEAGAEGAPDFIVEILSPKAAFLDKKSKRKVYARSGVKELCLVEPEAKTVHVYFFSGRSRASRRHVLGEGHVYLVTFSRTEAQGREDFQALKREPVGRGLAYDIRL